MNTATDPEAAVLAPETTPCALRDRRRQRFQGDAGILPRAAMLLWVSSVSADVICANGVVDGGENCDDGGTCVGGSNAGAACAADAYIKCGR